MRRTYALVSLLIGIPCVWQPHIQACDLSSHLYNAWLVNQVSDGQLLGLYTVPQFTNVLFDHLLSFLMKHGSALIAEKVAVLLAVQVFFWGCFQLASVIAGRPRWTAAPFLAMVAYGAVFRMGFFNFYLAVGICAWAIALVWRNHPRLRLLAIPLLALAFTAHAIPCLWAIGVLVYLLIARRLRPSNRYWLLTAGMLGIAGSALFAAVYIRSRWAAGLRIDALFGADQVLIYGLKYRFIEAALLCLFLLWLVRRFETFPGRVAEEVPFQLLLLNAAAVLFLPDAIWFSQYHLRFTYIGIRLSLLSAILLSLVIARVNLHPMEKAISGVLLALFFSFTYVDERAINLVEQKMSQTVATLPAGARAIATLRDDRLYLPALQHLIDRACIGRCFDFANYEPSTAQFRLRARSGNQYVMTSIEDILDLENTEYVWRNRGVQLYRLLPCHEAKGLCVSVVQPGEKLVNQQVDATPVWWKSR